MTEQKTKKLFNKNSEKNLKYFNIEKKQRNQNQQITKKIKIKIS